MGFWSRDPDRQSPGNGVSRNGGTSGDAADSVATSDALRAAVVLWEANAAQARLVDGALAGATETAQSLRQTAEQAESIATSGEELASTANELKNAVPAKNIPAMATMTVRPEIQMDRPDAVVMAVREALKGLPEE